MGNPPKRAIRALDNKIKRGVGEGESMAREIMEPRDYTHKRCGGGGGGGARRVNQQQEIVEFPYRLTKFSFFFLLFFCNFRAL